MSHVSGGATPGSGFSGLFPPRSLLDNESGDGGQTRPYSSISIFQRDSTIFAGCLRAAAAAADPIWMKIFKHLTHLDFLAG